MTTPFNPDDMRIGTSEREAAINALGEHFAAGRLDMSEYEQRVSWATEAQTAGELRQLFADLPGSHQVPPPPFLPAPPPPQHVYVPPPLSDKSKVAAGLLQVLLPFGVGRFYTGHIGIGVAQLLTVFVCGAGIVWSFVDGIILLINGGTDAHGRRLRD